MFQKVSGGCQVPDSLLLTSMRAHDRRTQSLLSNLSFNLSKRFIFCYIRKAYLQKFFVELYGAFIYLFDLNSCCGYVAFFLTISTFFNFLKNGYYTYFSLWCLRCVSGSQKESLPTRLPSPPQPPLPSSVLHPAQTGQPHDEISPHLSEVPTASSSPLPRLGAPPPPPQQTSPPHRGRVEKDTLTWQNLLNM